MESDTGHGDVFGEAEDEAVDPEFRKNFNAVKAEFIQHRINQLLLNESC
jgi:hypothetical protein